jgi:hypothetical protein
LDTPAALSPIKEQDMPIPPPQASPILSALRQAMRDQGTNPYQIAKSSGMPLTTVQRLLTVTINVPLRNVETLMKSLGLEPRLVGRRASRDRPPVKGRSDG